MKQKEIMTMSVYDITPEQMMSALQSIGVQPMDEPFVNKNNFCECKIITSNLTAKQTKLLINLW